jgi:hypothetical protein
MVAGSFQVGSLADPRPLQPWGDKTWLGFPFFMSRPRVLSYRWTGAEPRGSYLFFFAVTKSGALDDGVLTPDEILALATTTVTFP